MSAISDIVTETIQAAPTPSPIADQTFPEPGQGNINGDPSGFGSPNPTVSSPGFTISSPPSPVGYSDELFDPEIHATNEDGTVKLNKDGSFQKKRGRKPGSTNVASAGQIPGGDMRQANAVAAATATAQSIVILGVMVGGDEWRPVKSADGRDEMLSLTEAWTQYYLTMENPTVSPWLMVIIATGGYALPRLTMEHTGGRLKNVYHKFREWVSMNRWKKGQ